MIEKKDKYKKGKIITKAQKCEECNQYKIKPMHQDYHTMKEGFKDYTKCFYQCQNCYAEYEAIKE